MKKNIITLFIFFMLPTINLYSNFRCIMDGYRLYDFYRINDKILFTSYHQLLEKDLNTNKTKLHTQFTTDLELDVHYFIFEMTNSDENMLDNLWIYGDEKFTQISNLTTNPIPTKVISIEEIDGLDKEYSTYTESTDYLNGAIIARSQEEINSSIVYITTRKKLVKVNLDKPDSLLLEIPYSTATDDYWFRQMAGNHRDLLYSSQDSLLWFTTYYNNKIGQYNVNTQLLKVFDYTQLPVSKDFLIHNYFIMQDSNTGSNNIIFFISENCENKLLIYNSITKNWEIEEMGMPVNSLIYSTNDESYKAFLWPFNKDEIAVSFNNEKISSFCIYNRVTKQWRDFEVPLDFFHDENGNPLEGWVLTTLKPLKIDWIENNKSIGILYGRCLIEYTPSSSTDYISTDEGISQEIGIKNVYPNPIRRSSKVDIMCYVQDLSKIDIGLYDVLGTKILDLNNDFEYNPITHTITTTIEVPTGTPNGTYYLNVRNGSDFRTHAVVIEK